MKTTEKGRIVWRFFRAGGFDQVRLESARELMSLDKLDQKLWVALACPVDNVFFDRSTLSLIDTDNDGRIRPAELIAALSWVGKLLKDPETLLCGGDGITADAINETIDESKALAETVRRALKALGRGPSDSITVADTLSLRQVLSEKGIRRLRGGPACRWIRNWTIQHGIALLRHSSPGTNGRLPNPPRR